MLSAHIYCRLNTNEFLFFIFSTCLVEWEWRICDFSSPEYKTGQPPVVGVTNFTYSKIPPLLNYFFFPPLGCLLMSLSSESSEKNWNKFSTLGTNNLMLVPMPQFTLASISVLPVLLNVRSRLKRYPHRPILSCPELWKLKISTEQDSPKNPNILAMTKDEQVGFFVLSLSLSLCSVPSSLLHKCSTLPFQ
jgi:hypothetical protein